ncbi:hypothetical protein ACFFV7_47230 [Nonomuraea spiralis]|uniref:Uncharacterized protein n=1 Tax=Nonomuraea spiralis TaxID=46182 RepID=A0ABV5IXU8_9ACTN|nr:hypothetical protein [Nonomuraea spiralis]GGS85522.1 hypothetical protein GCM10010176_031580 [Nonomuraea spiralis]
MTTVMERISREGPLALLQTGTVRLVEALPTDAVAAAAFARPAFEGGRATMPIAGTGRMP